MKRFFSLFLLILCFFTACTEQPEKEVPAAPQRVVCLYASYAEAWLNAGGTLVGVTDDAKEERALPVREAVRVGGLQNPSLEAIVALQPDLVIASADIAGQLKLEENLKQLGIPTKYYTADTFEQYKAMTEEFLQLTDRADLRDALITKPEKQIAQVLAQAKNKPQRRVLLLRISSGGLKIKAEGTVAASIAESLGVVNIAKETPSLLQELSLEAVLAADPDVILVSVLGLEEDEAAQALEREFNAQTMWKSLRAVQAGDCHILSKALFHYKPNQRWGESYETFADLVWS